MARVLIVYGTTDGHTAKIAEVLARTLKNECGQVAVVDAKDAGGLFPDPYDAVIVAASIHAGGYQRKVRRWVRRHAPVLNDKASAFISVCLGVLQKDRPAVQREVGRIMDEFLDQAGWRPGTRKTVAGALPYTRYSWFKRWVMRRIAAKVGGDTDTSRDYEYTDWDDLRTFARVFALQHELAPGPGRGAAPAAAATRR
ncbi:MAG TPA: flavodoxin domain-containing protein [Gemmatimonadales bacterium]|nr:flavodoxin domain-containing protein [Gemmatimonadales bacterium]